MNLFILYNAGENLKYQTDKQALAINEFSDGINEGSEFLDDAIRMKDLPLILGEEKTDTEDAVL